MGNRALARTLSIVKVLSCRRVQGIFKDQFLPLVPSLGVYPFGLAWEECSHEDRGRQPGGRTAEHLSPGQKQILKLQLNVCVLEMVNLDFSLRWLFNKGGYPAKS